MNQAPFPFVAAKKADAQFAYCPECDTWLGNPYWSIQKSAGLHERGMGHSVAFYKIGQEDG